MANNSFAEVLENWRVDNRFPSQKDYRQLPSPIALGESLFWIEQKFRIVISGGIAEKDVTLSNPFYTLTSCSNLLGSSVDIYRLERFLISFDNDFSKTIDQTVAQIVKELNS